MPTLLDVIGIEPPAEIAGVAQRPLDGASFRARFADAGAPSPRSTQYYEMLGCRAIYHDGWKAVTFHPMVGFGYEGSDPALPFDDDVWELYHVAEDFSETDRSRRRGAGAAAPAGRAVVVGGRAQPGAAAEQPARPPRRPPPPAQRYEYHAGHRRAPGRRRAEPAQPRLPHHRRARPPGGRRRRRDRHPRRRRPAATPCTSRTAAALDVQLARRPASRRSPARARCRPGRCTVDVTFTPTGRFQGDVRCSATTCPIGKGHVPADDARHLRHRRVHRRLPARHGGVADLRAAVRPPRRRAATRRRRARRPRVPRPAGRGAGRRRHAVAAPGTSSSQNWARSVSDFDTDRAQMRIAPSSTSAKMVR